MTAISTTISYERFLTPVTNFITATGTFKEELNNYLFTPATASNLYRLQDTINKNIRERASRSTYYTGTGDLNYNDTGTTNDTGTANNFKIYTTGGTNYNPYGEIKYEIDSDTFYTIFEQDEKESKRQRIKNNLLIRVKSRADLIGNNVSENEQIALDSLREMITEKEFRKYLKYGFILVKGQSGSVYQVFRNRHHTKVWRGGKLIEEICVRIKNNKIPLTDNTIAFKTMIEASENDFKKIGNVYKMDKAS